MLPVSRQGRERGRISFIRLGLISTTSLLAFVLATERPARAEQAAPTPDTQVRPVDVSAPRVRQRRTAQPSAPARPVRRAPAARPPVQQVQAPPPVPPQFPGVPLTSGLDGRQLSPLNGSTVTQTGTRLGIPAREVPATIDVVSQEYMREQGYRTTAEAAYGSPGVQAIDVAGAPANFMIRGLSFGEVNVLYNGISVGPANITSRWMDTG